MQALVPLQSLESTCATLCDAQCRVLCLRECRVLRECFTGKMCLAECISSGASGGRGMAHAFTMHGALNVKIQLPMQRSQGHVGATVNVSHMDNRALTHE